MALNNRCSVENVMVLETNNSKEVLMNKHCQDCKVYKMKVKDLELKINQLKIEQLKILETIQPYPALDQTLLEENKVLEKKINYLEHTVQTEKSTHDQIIQLLNSDIREISIKNSQLRSQIAQMNEELSAEFTLVRNGGHGQKPKVDTIDLNNRFETLTSNDTLESISLAEELADVTIKLSNMSEIDSSTCINKKRLTVPNSLKAKSNNTKNRSNILLLADSHGRGISKRLINVWPNTNPETNICSFVKPNAKLAEIIKELNTLTKAFTKKDTLIIFGGSNDNIINSKTLLGAINTIIKQTVHTNVAIAAVPYQHNNPGVNDEITILNFQIKQLVGKSGHTTFIPLHELPRNLYTKHGFHFNRHGKVKIAHMIKNAFGGEGVSETKNSKVNSLENTDGASSGIRVVEGDMRQFFDKFESDQSTAFSHAISRDVEDDRNMTAGVAVAFRKRFGRPTRSDCLSEFLSCQKINNGATVFGLRTKNAYKDKPTREEYDRAFEELTAEFKRKNLQRLICSPMGCVRDHIKPLHFASKIVDFQHNTGALVTIVTADQPTSRRTLWDGLSHPDFVKALREALKISMDSSIVSLPTKATMPALAAPGPPPSSQLSNLQVFPPLPSGSQFSQPFPLPSQTVNGLRSAVAQYKEAADLQENSPPSTERCQEFVTDMQAFPPRPATRQQVFATTLLSGIPKGTVKDPIIQEEEVNPSSSEPHSQSVSEDGDIEVLHIASPALALNSPPNVPIPPT